MSFLWHRDYAGCLTDLRHFLQPKGEVKMMLKCSCQLLSTQFKHPLVDVKSSGLLNLDLSEVPLTWLVMLLITGMVEDVESGLWWW